MKRVGINAHLLSGEAGFRSAGIHQYIKGVLNHLPSVEGVEYCVFTGRGGAGQLAGSLSTQSSRFPTEKPLVRIAWEQAAWPIQNALNKIDLGHSMAFVTPVLGSVPNIVTVYDLSFVHYPDRFSRFKRAYLGRMTKLSVESSVQVVCISEDGKRDVHEQFNIPLEKIEVVTPGVGDTYGVIDKAIVQRFLKKEAQDKPYILHLGTLQPRKNIPTLIDAFHQLSDFDGDLVFIGGKGWMYEEIFGKVRDLGLESRVRFVGYAPDEEIPLWYNGASVLVLASVYEGFGMPVAEAMACGTPVIGSNVSSIPEVVGSAGLLFDPHDSEDLAECLRKVLNNPTQQDEMRKRGVEQARKFRWIQSGQKMAAIYQQLLGL